MSVVKSLRTEILRRRTARGLTQEKAAFEMGMASRTLRRLENGESRFPKPHNIAAMKRVLGFSNVEIRELLQVQKYHIAGPEFVEEQYNKDYIKLAERLLEIDYSTIENLTVDYSGTAIDRAPIFENNPDTWQLLVCDNKIVGYWQVYFLRDQVFDRILRGEISDGEITELAIEPLAFRGRYKAYFNIIATEGGMHRSAEPVIMLLEAVIEKLTDLARLGIFISDLCANAFSAPGKRVCELLGMNEFTSHKRQGAESSTMYRMNGAGVGQGYLRRFEDLVTAYQSEFGKQTTMRSVAARGEILR